MFKKGKQMNKRLLGLDLDGVLYPWQEQMLQHLQLYYNYTGTMRDLFCGKDGFFNSHNVMWRHNMTRLEPIYNTRPPSKEQMQTVHNLSEQFELVYITNRPEDVRMSTERYLRVYDYPDRESLIMCDDKVTEVRMISPDFYVEDRGDIATKLKEFTHVILYAQEWNEEYQNNFSLVHNLGELESMLLSGESI
jgi:uncharacterized HAD superfamily protein